MQWDLSPWLVARASQPIRAALLAGSDSRKTLQAGPPPATAVFLKGLQAQGDNPLLPSKSVEAIEK